jgi:antibiotic biosynthesis monooxygenase (ABM) superfamily enzyme
MPIISTIFWRSYNYTKVEPAEINTLIRRVIFLYLILKPFLIPKIQKLFRMYLNDRKKFKSFLKKMQFTLGIFKQ